MTSILAEELAWFVRQGFELRLRREIRARHIVVSVVHYDRKSLAASEILDEVAIADGETAEQMIGSMLRQLRTGWEIRDLLQGDET